jgi:hypothetical protein
MHPSFSANAGDASRRIFVGEAWLQTPQQMSRYIRRDELHTGFNFASLCAEWSAPKWRHMIDQSLACDGRVGAPTTWVTENHDWRRAATRYAAEHRLVGRETPTEGQLEVSSLASAAAMIAIDLI